ncbi:MAG: hypothetical protein ACTSXG_01575 [Alphaproteobacteria bacterium]
MLIFIALLFIIIFIVLMFKMLTSSSDPPCDSELDLLACDQMRESGWTEIQIEKFANKHNMWFFREDTRKI